ncbi:MAG: M20/M25/M40 family metallo-hydrolase, partial [Candidatus Xenobia bacterium]
FLAHMDTVDIAQGVKPQENNGVISSDGSTALGGDDRAGISEIFEMLQVLKENNLPHPPMQIIFTVAEEAGLVGSSALDPKDVHGKLGFEADYFHPNQILWGDDWGGTDNQPHPNTPDEQFLDDFTQGSIRDLGMTPQRDDLPGASSDSANLRKNMGIPALIIGVGEQDVHTTDEHISVADIKQGTALMLDIIQRANQYKMADGKIVPRGAAAAEEWHLAA